MIIISIERLISIDNSLFKLYSLTLGSRYLKKIFIGTTLNACRSRQIEPRPYGEHPKNAITTKMSITNPNNRKFKSTIEKRVYEKPKPSRQNKMIEKVSLISYT
jgi:hypothetical protein